jgi:molybdopterin/thiamine biosynthesis adenylyltransferase
MDALTKEEAAIYDRQLRVWGVEAQQRFVNLYASNDFYDDDLML